MLGFDLICHGGLRTADGFLGFEWVGRRRVWGLLVLVGNVMVGWLVTGFNFDGGKLALNTFYRCSCCECVLYTERRFPAVLTSCVVGALVGEGQAGYLVTAIMV